MFLRKEVIIYQTESPESESTTRIEYKNRVIQIYPHGTQVCHYVLTEDGQSGTEFWCLAEAIKFIDTQGECCQPQATKEKPHVKKAKRFSEGQKVKFYTRKRMNQSWADTRKFLFRKLEIVGNILHYREKGVQFSLKNLETPEEISYAALYNLFSSERLFKVDANLRSQINALDRNIKENGKKILKLRGGKWHI